MKELVDDYVERFANPYIAAQRGYVDDVIEAHRTRGAIATALDDACEQTRRTPAPQTRQHPAVATASESPETSPVPARLARADRASLLERPALLSGSPRSRVR